MPDAIWELAGSTARLQLAAHDLQATLDFAQVSHGFSEWRLAGRPLPGYRLLGVNLAIASATPQIEAYARGGDLVATFAETSARPMRVQVYWRVHSPTPAIDLQVSVQTNLLDSHPELVTISELPAGEILRLANPDRAEFERFELPGDTATDTSCLVFRPSDSDTSYIELLHPTDLRGDTLSLTDNGLAVRLQRKLFATFLEKGVILRSRSRGLWVPRRDDTRRAAEAYAEFLTTELPLTT